MKIATNHGFPKASFGGSDPGAFAAFKNERDYIAQGDRMQGTVAAMDWAAAEIERLRAALQSIVGMALGSVGIGKIHETAVNALRGDDEQSAKTMGNK